MQYKSVGKILNSFDELMLQLFQKNHYGENIGDIKPVSNQVMARRD